MSADSDTSLIPAEYHSAILYLAMLYYAQWDNAPELAERARQMLEGRDTDSKDKGLIKLLEAAQLPNAGHVHGISSGNLNIEVMPQ